MKGFGEKNQSKINKISQNKQTVSSDQLIKKAFELQSQGRKSEAAKYYVYLIKQGIKDCRVFSNYGIYLDEIGRHKEAELKLKKAIEFQPKYANAYFNLGCIYINQGNLIRAEIFLRKAIELKSDFALAHYNLGFILKDLGRLKEAELYNRKAIEVDPQLTDAYLSLSTIDTSDTNQKWKNQLFSKRLLKNKNNRELVNIFFARSNIYHKKGKFAESAENLVMANSLKLKMHKSNSKLLFLKTNQLKTITKNLKNNYQECSKNPISIFIVGLPRCGSTLIESIISLNNEVKDLGEVNIFEEAFEECRKSKHDLDISESYRNKIKNANNQTAITTNKWLFNYQYAGIISKTIPNAKIIHCYRNPLDNILSIYRAHFAVGNTFSSSLIDCAKVYFDQEEIMENYKTQFRKQIYDLNYDNLVTNPSREIKSLILWLGWDWDKKYLSPHLNKRKVLTRSNVEVRSPINSKSVGGWKNYNEMLKPAIKIITQKDKYKDLKY